ncbi:hypothetical protein [Salmonella enterica]|uniref:hypothetical protein n=1 Tax=Salmonella enterica TaxID=28901 RepID=UPI003D317382
MKNLKKNPVKFSQAEATPDGINLAVRVSLAVNVEGVAFEKYGSEEGLKLAIRMYREMTDDGEEMSLSAFGRETFTKLHDETVRMI